MSLYAKLKAASDARDVTAYLDCLHDDFVFVRHQAGTEVSKAEWIPTVTAMMDSAALSFENQRCLYENDDPGRIRTCNLPLRRGLLYPVEPRGHLHEAVYTSPSVDDMPNL